MMQNQNQKGTFKKDLEVGADMEEIILAQEVVEETLEEDKNLYFFYKYHIFTFMVFIF